MPYIDLHTHAAIPEKDVIAIRNVFPKQAETAGNADHPYFSVGLHPWYINPDIMLAEMDVVKTLATHPFCLAIGECGLDKLTQTPFDLQKEIFAEHLEIACEVSKPLIIHCVKAFQEILQLHKPFAGKVQLIFHGFNNNHQIMKQLLDRGCFLSFGKALLNPGSNASKLFPEIPDDRFFLETDVSDLSIKDVYFRAATLKNVTVESIMSRVEMNANLCFDKRI